MIYVVNYGKGKGICVYIIKTIPFIHREDRQDTLWTKCHITKLKSPSLFVRARVCFSSPRVEGADAWFGGILLRRDEPVLLRTISAIAAQSAFIIVWPYSYALHYVNLKNCAKKLGRTIVEKFVEKVVKKIVEKFWKKFQKKCKKLRKK